MEQVEAESPAPILEPLTLEYAAMVVRLAKPGSVITAQMDAVKAHHWHMATGISGEAGELLDAVKKAVCYNKPLDLNNVVEELGDLEFYMEGLRNSLGITRERTLLANMDKLEKKANARYKEGYSDEAAQARADKAETLNPLHGIEGAPGDANGSAAIQHETATIGADAQDGGARGDIGHAEA